MAGPLRPELLAGDQAAAFVSVIRGTSPEGLIRYVPRPLLVAFFRLAFTVGSADPELAGIRELLPTMQCEARAVRASGELLAQAGRVRSRVLLLGGSRSFGELRRALDLLEATLSHPDRIEIHGSGHLAADNSGVPGRVAAILRTFWSGDGVAPG